MVFVNLLIVCFMWIVGIWCLVPLNSFLKNYDVAAATATGVLLVLLLTFICCYVFYEIDKRWGKIIKK